MSQTIDRMTAAIVETDAVTRAAELRWGVARLPSLVSADTLLNWRKGWTLYAQAIQDSSAFDEAVREAGAKEAIRLAPKIAQAVLAMEAEAEAAGHQPLSPTAWETPLADGRVLVVTRTFAEASALQGATDGRERVVWTMEELANVLPQLEQIYEIKTVFPGARVQSSVKKAEGFAHDWAKDDFTFLHGDVVEP